MHAKWRLFETHANHLPITFSIITSALDPFDIDDLTETIRPEQPKFHWVIPAIA